MIYMLCMKSPVVVSISPDKNTIRYLVANHVSIEKTFDPIAKEVYNLQTATGGTIIFRQKLDDCCKLYQFLGKN